MENSDKNNDSGVPGKIAVAGSSIAKQKTCLILR